MQRTAPALACASSALFLLAAGSSSAGEDLWVTDTREGTLLREQGRYLDAETKYLNAYRVVADTPGGSQRLIRSLNNLTEIYRDQSRYADAESCARRALAACRQLAGPKSSDTGIAMNNLAEIYSVQAKFAAAEPLYLQAIAINEGALPR